MGRGDADEVDAGGDSPAACQAVAKLGMHSIEGLGVKGGVRFEWGFFAGQQQVQERLPLPERLQGVPQQECQQRKLHTAQCVTREPSGLVKKYITHQVLLLHLTMLPSCRAPRAKPGDKLHACTYVSNLA